MILVFYAAFRALGLRFHVRLRLNDWINQPTLDDEVGWPGLRVR